MHDDKNEVLIVDDDAAVVRLLRFAFRGEGFGVTSAENGLIGLEVVELNAPSVIILDVHMPVMDGYGFYRALRERGYRMPVLIFSANNVKAMAEEVGADDYLAKPSSPDEVIAAVRVLLKKAA